MPVRAKMTVVEKREYDNYGGGKTHGVKLQAVAGGSDASEENKAFWQYTPSGQVEVSTIRPEVAVQFELGKSYYVDFSPAPD